MKLLHPNHKRSGFTIIEMLIAASLAAMITASAAVMINAVVNASDSSKEYRQAKTSGRTAMSRLTSRIRQARAIGEVTPTSMMLWENDTDGDDKVDDTELAEIKFDSGNKQITETTLKPSLLDPLGLDVGINPLIDSVAYSLLGVGREETKVIAEDIERLRFSGYPDNTDTRIVNIDYQISGGDRDVTFRDSTSPRAPADYTFVDDANEVDAVASRVVRKEVSRWTGYADVRGETVTYPGD